MKILQVGFINFGIIPLKGPLGSNFLRFRAKLFHSEWSRTKVKKVTAGIEEWDVVLSSYIVQRVFFGTHLKDVTWTFAVTDFIECL